MKILLCLVFLSFQVALGESEDLERVKVLLSGLDKNDIEGLKSGLLLDVPFQDEVLMNEVEKLKPKFLERLHRAALSGPEDYLMYEFLNLYLLSFSFDRSVAKMLVRESSNFAEDVDRNDDLINTEAANTAVWELLMENFSKDAGVFEASSSSFAGLFAKSALEILNFESPEDCQRVYASLERMGEMAWAIVDNETIQKREKFILDFISQNMTSYRFSLDEVFRRIAWSTWEQPEILAVNSYVVLMKKHLTFVKTELKKNN